MLEAFEGMRSDEISSDEISNDQGDGCLMTRLYRMLQPNDTSLCL